MFDFDEKDFKDVEVNVSAYNGRGERIITLQRSGGVDGVLNKCFISTELCKKMGWSGEMKLSLRQNGRVLAFKANAGGQIPFKPSYKGAKNLVCNSINLCAKICTLAGVSGKGKSNIRFKTTDNGKDMIMFWLEDEE